MLKKIGLGFVALIVVLVIVIATRPSTYHVERKTTIAAPAQHAHAIVNDFHSWKRFNPWDKVDPNMKSDFGGSTSGKGATYHWVGNDDVGEGRMTIEDSSPESIKIKLEFLKPFEGHATNYFTFKPAASGTDVTWSMDGENNFIGKAMGLVMNMDTMIGGMYEKGLASLKTAAEEDAKVAAPK